MRQPELGNVLAFVTTPQLRARIHDAIGGRARVRIAESFDQLLDMLRTTVMIPDVVIVSARDAAGVPAERVIRQIAKQRPAAAIVAWCSASTTETTALGALSAAGVHEFIITGLNDVGVVLRSVIERARRTSAGEQVLNRIATLLPAALHPVAEAILLQPERVNSIRAIANELGIHRKTLFNWSRKSRSLPPGELLGWCRLALVAYHLDNTGCTVETIALNLAYPSPTALRNTIKRYTAMTASELRRRGAFPCVMRTMEQRIRS